jgi:2-oxoglutarate ferredoxin oxidoreductase subunit alpha
VAVTGSSGPGISLKTEAIGWGVMAEIPVIICDVQRGGPSTGMPTNVEQSDLNLACFGGHGDSPRVVLAPSSVEDCFYTAIEAVNLARKFNVPVFILSDQSIATRIEAFQEPDLQKCCQDLTPDLSPLASYIPYPLDGRVEPRPALGTPILDGQYPVVTGLEHDEMGHPTGSPKLHTQMTARRRRKLQKLAEELPVPQVYGPPEGNILLVGWGSTKGPIKEAVDRARAAGDSVSALNLRHISPLPPGLENIFAGFNHVIVVEMNDEGLYGYGQLAGILRARFCNPKIGGLNKTDGLTWRVREILERAKTHVAAGLRKL